MSESKIYNLNLRGENDMSENFSTERLIEAIGAGMLRHAEEDAIVVRLRDGDRLCEAAKEIIGRGVKGLVEDKDNDRCWLILMDMEVWANGKKAVADYEGKEAR